MTMKRSRLNKIRTVVLLFTALVSVCSMPIDNYQQERNAILTSENDLKIGAEASKRLTSEEQLVDKLLMDEKKQIIEAARLNGAHFPVKDNFLISRSAMEQTTGFRVIRKMPKGGVLHIHDEAITSIDWLVKNVTYRPNCYMCVDTSFNVKFHFYDTPPSREQECEWRLISTYRSESDDIAAFDRTLHNNITMVTPDPERTYPTIDAAWTKFRDYFDKVEGLMLYAPVFEDYLYEGLRQFREDNVQYLEIRGLLPEVYELNGNTHNKAWVLALYKRVINNFVRDFPDFTGAKLINTALKFKEPDALLVDVRDAMELYKADPSFMVGFDLVGQEDPLKPLHIYLNELLYPSQQNPPVNLPYFLHAGETDWQETDSDYNLLDAILLNTQRIGHGYGLVKHPVLKEMAAQRSIPLEVNPISNQVLKLVSDPRNHPAATLIAEGFSLVISSDDPAAWEAAPLSHDFYVTFMALTGENTGLGTLKQLAQNSLSYSAMSADEKRAALSLWEEKWNKFIENIVHEFHLQESPIIG